MEPETFFVTSLQYWKALVGSADLFLISLPVCLRTAGSVKAEMCCLAQPPNIATVMAVTKEQQRTLAILWPRLISS